MTIYWTRQTDGRWSVPEVAPFAADSNYHHFEPCLSVDGRRIYFLTNRPAEGKEDKPGWTYQNIWAADRGPDGLWGKPYDPGPHINGDGQQFFPSLTRDGILYFTRVDGQTKKPALWRARPAKKIFGRREAPGQDQRQRHPLQRVHRPRRELLDRLRGWAARERQSGKGELLHILPR